jgi:hypothetical protein
MEVEGSERISRFLFHKNTFSKEKKIVKPNAFYDTKNPSISVCCSQQMSEPEIWDTAERARTAASQRNPNIHCVYGRADLSAEAVFDQGLTIQRDDEGYFGHANITGWPEEPDKRLAVAQQIASKCKLELR